MKYLYLILSLSLILSMESGNRLVFVYNAKSGVINGIFDYVHKFVSPSTYSCISPSELIERRSTTGSTSVPSLLIKKKL